jgi:hypothetical protein
MADDIIIDKSIVYIDSENGTYIDTNYYDFYIEVEPFKNVMYIKILDTSVSLDVNGNGTAPALYSGKINSAVINNLDPIYISLNEYNRLLTNNSTNTKIYFDEITLDKSKDYSGYSIASTGGNYARMTFNSAKDISSCGFDIYDPNVYVTNPMIPILKRFNVKLYDKNNNIIKKDGNLERFTMKLCIYHSRKKITMY